VVVAVGVNGSSSGELCVCPHFAVLTHSGPRALGVRESRKARRSMPGRARGRRGRKVRPASARSARSASRRRT
jgi:hypothetical protein